MEKDVIIRHQNIIDLSEEIEVLFTLIEEIKNETYRQDGDIQTINDMIEESKKVSLDSGTDIQKSEEIQTSNNNLLKGGIVGLSLTSLLYFQNPYILLTSSIVGLGTILLIPSHSTHRTT